MRRLHFDHEFELVGLITCIIGFSAVLLPCRLTLHTVLEQVEARSVERCDSGGVS